MKISLIISVFLLIHITVSSQELYKIPSSLTNKKIFVDSSQHKLPILELHRMKSSSKGSDMIDISGSGNVYSVFYPFTRPLSYNKDANLLMFMHRGGGFGTSINDIISSISSDGGMSWKDIVVETDKAKNHRHPSGFIFNPNHETDYTKAMAVYCGPVTDEVNWTENYFGSMYLDNSNKNIEYIKTPDQVAMQGLTVCDDSIAHVLGLKIDTNAQGEGVQISTVMNNGRFNASTNRFDWSSKIISPTWPKDKYGNTIFPGNTNQAWSIDGKIGYIFFIGIDSTIDLIYPQPIVYKSLDKGQNWTRLPSFNFSSIKDITKYLWGSVNDTSVKKPFFGNETYCGEVDFKGNLHIFSQIMERGTINSDTIEFFYNFILFDVFTKNDSVWDASAISYLQTLPVSEYDKCFGNNYNEFIGWDHRLQMSKTRDGKKLFFIWADSEADSLIAKQSWNNNGYINRYPNIFGFAKDIENEKVSYRIDFTSLSEAAYISFWHYVSEYVIEDSAGYKVPVVITPILDSYSKDPDKPVSHYYLPGIYFSKNEFGYQSISIPSEKNIGVSNFPNPFQTQTTFHVTLNQTGPVILTVYDVSGRLMDEVNYGKLSAGNHDLKYNRTSLSDGVYIYSLKSISNTFNGKFIVN